MGWNARSVPEGNSSLPPRGAGLRWRRSWGGAVREAGRRGWDSDGLLTTRRRLSPSDEPADGSEPPGSYREREGSSVNEVYPHEGKLKLILDIISKHVLNPFCFQPIVDMNVSYFCFEQILSQHVLTLNLNMRFPMCLFPPVGNWLESIYPRDINPDSLHKCGRDSVNTCYFSPLDVLLCLLYRCDGGLYQCDVLHLFIAPCTLVWKSCAHDRREH